MPDAGAAVIDAIYTVHTTFCQPSTPRPVDLTLWVVRRMRGKRHTKSYPASVTISTKVKLVRSP
jgi:hypothetical protein